MNLRFFNKVFLAIQRGAGTPRGSHGYIPSWRAFGAPEHRPHRVTVPERRFAADKSRETDASHAGRKSVDEAVEAAVCSPSGS